MAHHDWDPRDDRAFHPSSVPTAQLIGLHLADRGVHEKSRQLWFIVDKRHVYFRLDDIYSMWAPGNLRLAGLITTWEGHPEYDSHHFHLGWHNATRRKNGGLRQTATLTVHNVTPPCGVCGSRTNRHGWTFECPTKACNFSIPDPAAPPPEAEPPHCMQCGVNMLRAGSIYACPSCGSTKNAI